YQELNQHANRIAHWLLQQGLGPGQRVGVLFAPGIELLAALLGVLKAGCAYVPLDPQYPAERLRYMLTDAGAGALLRESRHASLPLDYAGPSLCTNDAAGESVLAGQSDHDPAVVIGLDDPLYVIYTSGSTGLPKGAGVYHRGMVNLLHWYTREFDMGVADRNLVISAPGFDLTQKNFYAPLISGGTVVFTGSPEFDPAAIIRVLAGHGVTLLNCAPSAFYALLEQMDDFTPLGSLRALFLGGEPIHMLRLRSWLQDPGGACEIVNSYGPTECSDVVAAYRIREPARWSDDDVPLGRPIDNVQLYVLDPNGQLLPTGLVGELCIAGAGVGAGYLNNPALTAAQFQLNPFGAGQLYHTGDLVRYRPDGNLEFIGRRDFQVKLRGLRIDLGEIEVALRSLSGVTDSLVTVQDERLVAYLIGEGLDLDALDWRGALRVQLPDYMVPAGLVALSAWPLNANGKIDRGALPSVPITATATYVAPRTPTERRVAELWMDVLRIPQVGVEDNFFELGGHSLLATQIIARIQKEWQIDLPLRVLFEATTVARLATAVDEAKRSGVGLKLAPLTPRPPGAEVPLTQGQRGLWLMQQLAPDSPLFNMPAALLLRGPLDLEALATAFQMLMQRHESLRTTFPLIDGEPIQQVHDHPLGLLQVEDAPLPDGVDAMAYAGQLALAEAQRPFDLVTDPPVRMKVARLGSDLNILMVTVHHLAADGWSVPILQHDLVRAYAAARQGVAPTWQALQVQYADYAVWEAAQLSGDTLQTLLDYWRGQLEGAPDVLRLPTDRPRGTVQTFKGAHLEASVPDHLPAAVDAFCRSQGVTPFVLYLAAYQLLLSRYSGQKDLCVGVPIAGRDRVEVEPLVGYFINSLVIRTDLAGNPTAGEYLESVRQVVLEAFAHQQMPVTRLLDELRVGRHAGYAPGAQVAFQLQNRMPGAGDLQLEGLSAQPVVLEGNLARYELTLSVAETDAGLSVAADYNTDLFDASTIEQMMAHYWRLVAGLIADQQQPLDRVSVLDSAELMSLLGVDAAQVEQILPLTPNQRDIYLDALLRPDTLQNNMGWAARFSEPVDEAAWQQALQQVTDAEPVLRTSIVGCSSPYADVAYQVVYRSRSAAVEVVDLSTQQVPDVDLSARLRGMVQRPYDISRDGLIRHALLKLRDGGHVRIEAFHHILLDGVSGSVLARKLFAAYEALRIGAPTQTVPGPFVDFVTHSLASTDRHMSLDFWSAELAGAEAPELPSSGPSDGAITTDTASIDAKLWIQLQRYARSQRVTPVLLLKCLYGLLLSRHARNAADFWVLEFASGRARVHEDSLGCFYAQLPFVFRQDALRPDTAIGELLGYARDFQRRVRDHRQLSIGAQTRLLPAGRLACLFNFYHFVPDRDDVVGKPVTTEIFAPPVEGSLNFVVQGVEDALVLTLGYPQQAFEAPGFLDRFVALCRQLVAGAQALGDFQLLTPAERAQELSRGSGAPVPVSEACVHELVQAQVHRTPDAVAVQYAGEVWSYAQLNGRANRLARWLVARGVGPDARVGVLMHRSAELVQALLGTLKAGGAYVPLDPQLPAERLAYLVSDTGLQVVLTQSHLR
ncbi:amino acid adenylation domain-containing protein, partial [Immundisolibacter sp.]|uniref:amino acid adenylation domain-containing protein n=1 Tax=Immundisolibacter sp. TaxID=1934948 RepID=UPI003568CA28